MRIKRDNVYKALSKTPAMWQVLNEWPFPSLFQQESENTEYTGNTQRSSAWKTASTSDSENYGEIQFLNM